jgi:uncharacterized protein (TIGR01777 family)
MNILITGGTGLIGRHLCRILLAEGHQLTVLSRQPETVEKCCGAAVKAWSSLASWTPEVVFDAVINLAGEPIADKYWSVARKKSLWDSRVSLTEELVRRMAAAECKPQVLLSGSAIGYYGDQGDVDLIETAAPGNDFAAKLCVAWEAAALAAEALNVRVCLLRTGLVLSADGGLLAKLTLPFKFGLGATMGNGQQWMSWIHIDDYCAMLLKLLCDANLQGAYNLTSPQAARNAEFSRTLAATFRRPLLFSAPAFVLKLALGERANLLLGGQRVMPGRMLEIGFNFTHAELKDALHVLLSRH